MDFMTKRSRGPPQPLHLNLICPIDTDTAADILRK